MLRFETPHRIARGIVAGVLACALLAGCDAPTGPKSDPNPQTTTRPVYIQPAEFLAPPILGSERAYEPTCSFNLDTTTDDSTATVKMFQLEVNTPELSRLKARLTDAITGVTTELVHAEDAPSQSGQFRCQGDQLTQEANALLSDQRPTFWADAPDELRSNNNHQITVAIPESQLSPSAFLEFFLDETSSGAPRGGDRIELVQDFFYLAALGDSLVWGNGLLENDKTSSLVADAIEQSTGRKVIRTVYAISGATLAPTEFDEVCTFRCNGEVPTAYRSISLQIDTFEFPEATDLILFDGCINDVDISRIVSTETTPDEIRALTQRFCNEEMRSALNRLRTIAPQAPIIVNGYFAFVSEESDFSSVLDWAQAQGFDVDNVQELARAATTFALHSGIFHEASTTALQEAVQAANDRPENTSPIRFVDAGFGPQNAVFTNESWLWGLQLDDELAQRLGIDIGLVPEDPQLEFRAKACFEETNVSDPFTCLFASVGHPNPAGAKAYANAIIEALFEISVLSD